MIHIKDRLMQYKDKYSDCYKYAGVHVKVIQDMIEQLLADLEQDEKANGWIPVSERLPEIKMDYKECYLVQMADFAGWHITYLKKNGFLQIVRIAKTKLIGQMLLPGCTSRTI